MIASIDIDIVDFSEVTGKGSVIYFDLNSSSETSFVTGTYVIHYELNPATITEAYAQIDYDSSVPAEEKIVDFTSGQITVTKSNEEYSFVFTLNSTDGQVLAGTFKGSLPTISN